MCVCVCVCVCVYVCVPETGNANAGDWLRNDQHRVTDKRGSKGSKEAPAMNVSRCGLAVRRLAGKQKDLGSIRFGSPFSSLQKLWFMDTVL